MKRSVKVIAAGSGLLSVVLVGVFGWLLTQAMPIGTGYVAKYLCSATFVSQRDPETVFSEDVQPVNPLARFVTWRVDADRQSVTATAFGVFRSRALFREGCGCTLIAETTEAELLEQTFFTSSAQGLPSSPSARLPWPEGGGVVVDPSTVGVDPQALNRALDEAFAEPDPDRPRKTRAVAVVYDGRLIAERYAPGFDASTPLLGWSMSKSVTNALVGILVRDGRLTLSDPAPVPEWQAKGDPRGEITLDQLLRMSSGLAFEEVYRPLADVTEMLYGSYDFAAFAARRPLAAAPDESWVYSSGSANIIARIVRREAERTHANYYRFIREGLFDRIGMSSAVMEADPSGTFVGSSYTLATLRDWARFGLLYLQDGFWNEQRVLPAGWVTYTTTPTPGAPRGEYGALFWLNAGPPGRPQARLWPRAPVDAYAAQGFQEQKVIVVPSRRLVLVRFGATADRAAWDTDAFIAQVIDALPR